jgi:hypothetical protein
VSASSSSAIGDSVLNVTLPESLAVRPALSATVTVTACAPVEAALASARHSRVPAS